MKRIVLTGGGTAGHVTPNLALLPALRADGWDIVYIGSETGIEKKLIEAEGIPYYSIPTGKLRRYLSKQNISDMFRVVKGVKEAGKLLKELKPDLVFSKGGFVAVPVVLAAKKNKIPVIVHESDITPGLANKIAAPFAKTVCTTFPETVKYVGKGKGVHTGTPIRAELFAGSREKGLAMCGFTADKPVLMLMGGSLGAIKLNDCLREILPRLLEDFQVAHLCGKGHLDSEKADWQGYRQFEYVSDGLADLFAMADVLISRAGSNSISEFLALKKPHLLIPLSAKASRGDQILNARSFEKQGFSMVLPEEDMTPETMERSVRELFENREKYIQAMEQAGQVSGVEAVMAQIRRYEV